LFKFTAKPEVSASSVALCNFNPAQMSIRARLLLRRRSSLDIDKMTSGTSFKQFALENDMEDITQDNAAMDSIYKYDSEEQKKILAAKPWTTEYSLL
jgi:hypothetical protein